MKARKLMSLVVIALVVALSGCGFGSSGSGRQDGPAQVDIRLGSHAIDSGDRDTIQVRIYDIEENLVVAKVRYPTAFTYVLDSSYYQVNDRLLDTAPTQNFQASGYEYLIYLVAKDSFEPDDNGTLAFDLEAISNNPAAKVEVDVDFYDGQDTDSADPKFDAQEYKTVQIGPAASSSGSGSSRSSGAASSSAASSASSAASSTS